MAQDLTFSPPPCQHQTNREVWLCPPAYPPLICFPVHAGQGSLRPVWTPQRKKVLCPSPTHWQCTVFTTFCRLSLRPRSVQFTYTGKVIKKGELVGWLGVEKENGGWPPHLHLQYLPIPLLPCTRPWLPPFITPFHPPCIFPSQKPPSLPLGHSVH